MEKDFDLASKEALNLLKKKNARVVDVREPDEFIYGHLNESESIPLSELNPENAEKRFQKNEKILFVCRSGNRSRNLAVFLREKGFENVFNLGCGLIALNSLLEKKVKVLGSEYE